MTRYIDADALTDELIKGMEADTDKSIQTSFTKSVCMILCKAIERQPTIDAVPVRHGKWIIRDNPGTGWYRITCSECGENVTSEAPCIGFLPNAKVMWDYCPYCGARMDEE